MTGIMLRALDFYGRQFPILGNGVPVDHQNTFYGGHLGNIINPNHDFSRPNYDIQALIPATSPTHSTLQYVVVYLRVGFSSEPITRVRQTFHMNPDFTSNGMVAEGWSGGSSFFFTGPIVALPVAVDIQGADHHVTAFMPEDGAQIQGPFGGMEIRSPYELLETITVNRHVRPVESISLGVIRGPIVLEAFEVGGLS